MAGTNADIPGVGSARLPAPGGDVPKIGSFGRPPRTGAIRDMRGRFTGGMSVAWLGLEAVAALPARVAGDLQGATQRALEKLQVDMVEYAHQNAPWQDVTGDARAELHSPTITTAPNGDKTVVLAHGVSYGIYLETRDGGALGIIARTIDEFTAQLSDRIAAEMH